MSDPTTPELRDGPAASIHRGLTSLSNLLLIPMIALMAAEASAGVAAKRMLTIADVNLGFCAVFFAEWLSGLIAVVDRRAYLRDPQRWLDMVSSLPFGHVFQGARLVRLLRLSRMLRIVLRTRRLKGRAGRLLRAAGLVAASTLAGAIALRTVEPEIAPTLGDALWWSLVTLSTVGYGDIMPETLEGRIVGGALIVFGIGVFGYVAGIMSALMMGPDEDEALVRLRELQEAVARLEADARERRPDAGAPCPNNTAQ